MGDDSQSILAQENIKSEKNVDIKIEETISSDSDAKPAATEAFINKPDEADEKVVLKRKIEDVIDLPGKKARENDVNLENNADEEEEFYLTVSNLPSNWTYVDIKDYFDTECGPVDELEMLDGNKIRLTFQTLDKCSETMTKLQGKEVQGKKLDIEITELVHEGTKDIEPIITIQDEASETKEIVPQRPWRPDDNIWDKDPKGTYGLRPELLKALNIMPPLEKWVHVTDFRCDKQELRDVMELAGHVVMCQVIHTKTKYARVMYSHPLEAVQAVAMLNDQSLYGQKMKVKMFKIVPSMYILPKGLNNIGLGLGSDGKPLRDVVHEFQRYARKQDSDINTLLFSKLNEDDNKDDQFFKKEEESETVKKNIDALIATAVSHPKVLFNVNSIDETVDDASPNKSTITEIKKAESSKPASPVSNTEKIPVKKQEVNIAKTGTAIPNRVNPVVPPRVINRGIVRHNPVRPVMPMRPGPAPMMYRNGPPQGPFMPGPAPRPFPDNSCNPYGPPVPYGPGPVIPPMQQGMNFGGAYGAPNPQMGMNVMNKVMVEFSNLPPSTTFPILSEKLSHCGQVISVQLTMPGCAIATFGHPSQAERCFQMFNQMNVEGYVIGVKYV